MPDPPRLLPHSEPKGQDPGKTLGTLPGRYLNNLAEYEAERSSCKSCGLRAWLALRHFRADARDSKDPGFFSGYSCVN
ncbi:MAG: hypothetical protein JJU13_13370 [Balneolaceae bacterium]|nr:hypothetical protein [Balneolaceae bacterium]